jgi:hypothetical protein
MAGLDVSQTLLAYRTSGWIEGCNGASWPSRDEWLNLCAYCRGSLTDEGQFHTKGYNVVPGPDKARNFGLCMDCCNTAEFEPSKFRLHGRDEFFYPHTPSPGRACLLKVATCNRCGWWFAIERGHESSNGGQAQVYHGVLKEFDLTAADVPVDVLKSEIPRNLQKIGSVHPNRMEDLVGRILSGTYDCEVRQLGYTRDGGIDLILLLGEKPVAVQIKRRENLERSERVEQIREFLGAGMVEGYNHLLFVSTARKFSKGARDFARRAIEKELVAAYDLIDLAGLQALLESDRRETNWIAAIEEVANSQKEMPATVDPYELVSVSLCDRG